MMDTTKKLVFDQKIKFLDQSKARYQFPSPDNVFPDQVMCSGSRRAKQQRPIRSW